MWAFSLSKLCPSIASPPALICFTAPMNPPFSNPEMGATPGSSPDGWVQGWSTFAIHRKAPSLPCTFDQSYLKDVPAATWAQESCRPTLTIINQMDKLVWAYVCRQDVTFYSVSSEPQTKPSGCGLTDYSPDSSQPGHCLALSEGSPSRGSFKPVPSFGDSWGVKSASEKYSYSFSARLNMVRAQLLFPSKR